MRGRPVPKNKFEAAKRYDAGVRFCLFHEGWPDWDDELFTHGYNMAHANFKQTLFVARNTVLESKGYEPIGIITLQGKTP